MRTAGALVDHVFVNFYYDIFPESKKTLSDLNVRLHYLATWWDILSVVKKGGYLGGEQIAEVEAFSTPRPSGRPRTAESRPFPAAS